MDKDWNGNNKSAFVQMGARTYATEEREQHDYYATDPSTIDDLLKFETFNNEIWECAGGGGGHLSRKLEEHGYNVYSTDLIYRGYGDKESFNFLEETLEDFEGDIITNPPYKYCSEFILKALESIKTGNKVAMFLKLQTLEGQKRYNEVFKDNPPKVVYVYVKRKRCVMNGDFGKYSNEDMTHSAVAYAWFVWEKGFKGDPIIKWIN